MNISIIQSMINAIDKPAIFITPDYVIQAVNQPYQEVYSTQVDIARRKWNFSKIFFEGALRRT